MKVLSLKEPFATLIKLGYKKQETRSFKTSYRGELYIHASQATMPLASLEMKRRIANNELSPGKIIVKCQLVDCIYMDKAFLESMEKNPLEKQCGIYKEGRYAWILDKIEVLEKPILASGNLNIWDYYTIEDVVLKMKQIRYGWVAQHGITHENEQIKDLVFQKPKELEQSKVGICWEQVELERYYLKNNLPSPKTYLLIYYKEKHPPTHTFLVIEKEGKYYWLENSWLKYQGLHCYQTLEELLDDVKNKFINDQINGPVDLEYFRCYEYSKPKFPLTAQSFIKHCEKKLVNRKKL